MDIYAGGSLSYTVKYLDSSETKLQMSLTGDLEASAQLVSSTSPYTKVIADGTLISASGFATVTYSGILKGFNFSGTPVYAFVDGDIVYSHHVTFLRVYDDDMKYYLFRLFNTEYFHKFVTGYANGTNILGLLFDSVKQCEIEIPDKRTLCKFAKIMHTIERKKADVIKENQELEKLRDFLLPLLMSGQVKFNDK